MLTLTETTSRVDASNSTAKRLLLLVGARSTRARASPEKVKSEKNDVGGRRMKGFVLRRPELVTWMPGPKLGSLWSGRERIGFGVRVRVRRERMRR